jgi:polysaccharide export outer membrane protein
MLSHRRFRVYRLLSVIPLLIGAMAILLAQSALAAGPQSSPAVTTPAQGTTPLPVTSANPTAAPFVPGIPSFISVGDLIDVSVFGVPDYLQEVRVDANGQVTLPYIGTVKLAGMSLNDAEIFLAKRFSDRGIFRNPQVTITDKEYVNQDVTVLGEVQKPGLYPLAGKRTLFDIISAAGGTSQRAGNTALITHRDNPQSAEPITLSYDAKGLEKSNVPVNPGDTIVISKAGIVYVVGDVRVPTGVILENPNLTVIKAIAMAQGTTPNASEGKTRIIRRSADGSEVEIPVPLKKILEAKIPDPPLQADDILFVPNSSFKAAAHHSLDTMSNMATGVVTYSPFY